MRTQKTIPRALFIASVLCVVEGLIAFTRMLINSGLDSFYLDFGVIWFFVGIGLLRLSPGWRVCALFLIWIQLALLAVTFVIVACSQFSPVFTVAAFLNMAVILSRTLWLRHVLTRQDLVELFPGSN